MKKPKGMSYRRNAIYAVYQNDKMVVMGTQDECAAELGVQPSYIHWMTTPTGKRRLEQRHDKVNAQTAVVVDFEGR